MANFNTFPPVRTNYTALFDITQRQLGIDPTALVNIGLILAAISTALLYTGRSIYSYASNLILSSVHINEDDELYSSVMRYMSDNHAASQRFRSVKATTKAQSTWMEEESVAAEIGSEFDVAKLISYRALVSRAPILMTPFQSQHLFFHQGHLIYFKHSLHRSQIIYNSGQNERGYISLQCLGRSLVPLEKFLGDTQLYSLKKNLATTTIYRALGDFRDRLRWTSVLSRPERDIRTVILDRAKKQSLLADINEYLHPSTRRWYANHGIPYRRGYLFSGAPGTGKTSLTAALAGVFGLNIYVVSLLDPALTESQLNRLLSDVPNRCIVLLEDVDAAGLTRPGEVNKGTRMGNSAKTPAKATDEASLLKEAAGDGQAQKPPTEISLSGLLNAIDGVSSHEGRILVMTTNSPETLDKALIRPGRVDMHIGFQLPKRDEMRQLFLSMYRDISSPSPQNNESDESTNDKKSADTARSSAVNEKGSEKSSSTDDNSSSIELAEFEASDEMHEMAKVFAEALPEDRFSLAAIQGFLLRHKRNPKAACEGAADWAEKNSGGDE